LDIGVFTRIGSPSYPHLISPTNSWNTTMSKEQKSNKEDKKKPALNPKEKKAAKKAKKESKE
jgi:hypothetical protein